MPDPVHVVVVAGTRPEMIKQAPVFMALRNDPVNFKTTLLVTGQHREMLAQALQSFDIVPDIDLELMTHNQTLAELTGVVVKHVQKALAKLVPDWVLVQGDTTTAFAAALAAFYQGIKVGHVEAGLRTYDRVNPFPEEMNRRLISSLANLHFTPTQRASGALQREGIPADRIALTGNTVVDAIEHLAKTGVGASGFMTEVVRCAKGRLILVTCHRRESFGPDLEAILGALTQLAKIYPDHHILFPMHLNPNLRTQVLPQLSEIENVTLCDPIAHSDLLFALEHSQLVITDSGGIQEEAPSFGAPVIVIRHTTERPEGIEAGFAKIVAPDAEALLLQARKWLDTDLRSRLQGQANPYGDGRAAQRIAERLAREPR